MSSQKKMWIWVREDGEPACVLQVGTAPRGPGEVYEVTGARSRVEAAGLVSRARRPEPDAEQDPDAWAAWKKSAARARRVQPEEWSACLPIPQALAGVAKVATSRAGSTSLVLLPKHSLRSSMVPLLADCLEGEGERALWADAASRFELSGGSTIYMRSTEDVGAARGLTVDGAALVVGGNLARSDLWESVRAAQLAVEDPKTFTTREA